MKILEVKTEHTGPFKILIEVLKEILQETNIEFRNDNRQTKTAKSTKLKDELNNEFNDGSNGGNTNDACDTGQNANSESEYLEETETNKKEDLEEDISDDEAEQLNDTSGMKIIAVDSTKTVLINLKLDAKNFTKYRCKKSKITIGANLGCFYKLIKSMEKDDNLTLYMDHDDKNYLKIKMDNVDEGKETIFKMKLMDLSNQKLEIPDITFDAKIIMNSSEFHKLCRDMSQIAEYVEIKCSKNKVVFVCKGDNAERTTTYKNNNSSDDAGGNIGHNNITIKLTNANNNKPMIIQGIYELKNLVLFSKCASLCNDIEIYMKNDKPLAIKYTVATLGRIILCLAPINEERTTQYEDDDVLYEDEDPELIKMK
jgi:proliferating cell nuclear antigen